MFFQFNTIEVNMYESIRIGHADAVDSIFRRFSEKQITEAQMSIELVEMLTREIRINGEKVQQEEIKKVLSFELEISESETLIAHATSLLEELKKKTSSSTNTKPTSESEVVTSQESGKK